MSQQRLSSLRTSSSSRCMTAYRRSGLKSFRIHADVDKTGARSANTPGRNTCTVEPYIQSPVTDTRRVNTRRKHRTAMNYEEVQQQQATAEG
ncbi:hypothetical protein BIW11_07558 [Tropilaelaps mercedesae]|uniref:Uncharacterized protein n=1 Tax=Tropilaelaps mercedesae TaxID=418985 RepID=A0A1V9XTP2_9ACAR|nr:hypothetical protein BIW11_07558 [Tropilaelaps mercedesae]